MIPLGNSINKPLIIGYMSVNRRSAHLAARLYLSIGFCVSACLCVCVHLPLLWPWWDIHLLCPLTDIVKSYNTLLISLLPWPLSPFLQSQLQLCALSLEQFRGRLLRLKDEHIAGFLVKPLTVNNSGWRRMWHQPLVSNWLFWRRQTAFMVTFGELKQAERSQGELNVGLQLIIIFMIS